jgi:arylsulfatase A
VKAGLLILGLSLASWAAPPNVVILYTDDQGTLGANCYGSSDLHTPNIDRLAANGVRFTQAYAHTVCCPSRAAMLTGRHPQRSGVNSWTQGPMNAAKGINMAREEVTIAEALQAAGYRTALFGKWHVGSHPEHGPMKQGFDEFFGIRNGFIDNYNHYFLHGHGYHDLYEGTSEVFREGEYFPKLITDRGLAFLEANKDRPFLLYMGYNIPHYPEQALKEHEELYKDLPMPRRAYAAITTTTDFYIGQILDKLDALELTQDTIVILQSDNGHSAEDNGVIRVDAHKSGYPKGHYYSANGGGGNTGKWIGHKGTFLEGGVRVPAIVSWPARLPKGIVRDQTVTIMDWYPSILEWCGVRKPDVKLDGRSLQAVIDSQTAPSAHPVIYFQWQKKWAVREGDWKLIDGRSLHNLADEKPEVKNYIKEKPAVATALRARYEVWAADVFAPRAPVPLVLDFSAGLRGPVVNHGVKVEAGALRFDGGYLELQEHALPDPGNRGLKIRAEFQADAADGVILAQGGQSRGYAIYLQDGKACFAISGSAPIKAKTALPAGWVTVEAELTQGRAMTLRVNGKVVASGRAKALIAGKPGDGLQIGADTISPVGDYTVTNPFTGRIRELTIE